MSEKAPQNNGEMTSLGLGNAQKIVIETVDALRLLPSWERVIHVFWLLGPIILLIERSPADLALSYRLDFCWPFYRKTRRLVAALSMGAFGFSILGSLSRVCGVVAHASLFNW